MRWSMVLLRQIAGDGPCRDGDHQRTKRISRRLQWFYENRREVGRVECVYECFCGVAWQVTENETAGEYRERMADLDIAEAAKEKPGGD